MIRKHLFFSVFLASLCIVSTWIDAAPVRGQQSSIELISSVRTIQSGTPFIVGFRIKLDPHWHTYWRNPGDSGMGAKVEWALPDGFEADELLWPAPEKLVTPPLVTFGYEDEVILLAKITPPGAISSTSVTISANVSWLVCADVCLPEYAELSLPLAVAASATPDSENAKQIEHTLNALPDTAENWSFSARKTKDGIELQGKQNNGTIPFQQLEFFPYMTGIFNYLAPQNLEIDENGFRILLPLADTATDIPETIQGILIANAPWKAGSTSITAEIEVPLQGVQPTSAKQNEKLNQPAVDDALSTAHVLTKLSDFQETGRATGFMKAEPFIKFLSDTDTGNEGGLESRGLWSMLLFIFLGGIALNLTPCVLPLIPINLAIIGAGAQAKSRARGFMLGGVYGLGMALTYGALGIIVVLTGTTFGTLNASPWFNLIIGIVFVLLALAMFDVFHIDFTRFMSGKAGGSTNRGHVGAALAMGCIAALLAGACVAPVVISVLLLAGNLNAAGQPAGLLLPLLLGLGMGLPWPFAGAGLSFLPKPGGWMNWVKYGFGIFILALALYYGHLSYTLFKGQSGTSDLGQSANAEQTETGSPQQQIQKLSAAIEQAQEQNKPLFIDFWATWCKNCITMEKTTFKDPEVKSLMEKEFIILKFQAEQPSTSPVKDILDHLEVKGLPTYIILRP